MAVPGIRVHETQTGQSRGTEGGKPDNSARGLETRDRGLPPNGGYSPFYPDERIVWAFLTALRGSMGDQQARSLTAGLESSEAQVLFASGFAAGLVEGAEAVVSENVRATLELCKGLVTTVEKTYALVYDPKMLAAILSAYAAGDSPQARRQALKRLADHMAAHHPEVAEALRYLALVEPVMGEILRWFRQPGAAARIAEAASHELGRLIGEESRTLYGLAGQPRPLGREFGRIAGDGFAQVALFLLGF